MTSKVVFFFDDEVGRAGGLVENLEAVHDLSLHVSDDVAKLREAVGRGSVDLVLVDMGRESEAGVDLHYGEHIISEVRRVGSKVPVVVYTQYPITVPTRVDLTSRLGVRAFISKIAPERQLYSCVEDILDIDLGPARWRIPEDQVLIEIVAFKERTFEVILDVLAWPVGRQLAVPLAAPLFDRFRSEVLQAAGVGISEESPLLLYGRARLEESDPKKLGLRLVRVAGRYPSLDAINIDRLFKEFPSNTDEEA